MFQLKSNLTLCVLCALMQSIIGSVWSSKGESGESLHVHLHVHLLRFLLEGAIASILLDFLAVLLSLSKILSFILADCALPLCWVLWLRWFLLEKEHVLL